MSNGDGPPDWWFNPDLVGVIPWFRKQDQPWWNADSPFASWITQQPWFGAKESKYGVIYDSTDVVRGAVLPYCEPYYEETVSQASLERVPSRVHENRDVWSLRMSIRVPSDCDNYYTIYDGTERRFVWKIDLPPPGFAGNLMYWVRYLGGLRLASSCSWSEMEGSYGEAHLEIAHGRFVNLPDDALGTRTQCVDSLTFQWCNSLERYQCSDDAHLSRGEIPVRSENLTGMAADDRVTIYTGLEIFLRAVQDQYPWDRDAYAILSGNPIYPCVEYIYYSDEKIWD